jgi:stress-induced morphogen
VSCCSLSLARALARAPTRSPPPDARRRPDRSHLPLLPLSPKQTTPNTPRKLEAALKPTSLSIVNESHKHAGHSGNPSGAADAETHFRVEVVSAEFDGKRLVARHQIIYRLLDDEIKVGGVHALSMDTRTPGEVTEGK